MYFCFWIWLFGGQSKNDSIALAFGLDHPKECWANITWMVGAWSLDTAIGLVLLIDDTLLLHGIYLLQGRTEFGSEGKPTADMKIVCVYIGRDTPIRM